ncbi:MAG: signal peptidase I [Firmicutes bacterium]|nr:signal peptidase I [Bacillota bacterium]
MNENNENNMNGGMGNGLDGDFFNLKGIDVDAEDFNMNAGKKEEIPKRAEGGGGKPPKKDDKSGEEKVSPLSMLFDLTETLAISTSVIIIVFTFFVRLAVVDGNSMNNTLYDGDTLVVSDIFYSPRYGDIVVFQKTDSDYWGDTALVKRVIATGGQTIDIDFETWTVTVDGVVLDESEYRYLAADRTVTATGITFPYTVPEGCVFVMGDNRNHSTDSRNILLGVIDERQIFGRVVFDISSFTHFKRFS